MIGDRLYQRLVLSRRDSWDNFRTQHAKIFNALYPAYRLYKQQRWLKYRSIYNRFKDFTMLDRHGYSMNLALCDQFRHIKGAVVECGVWRGGMIAGIAYLFNDERHYYLYDSFEGLPDANELDAWPDGYPARSWQADLQKPEFADIAEAKSLKTDVSFAREAMAKSGARKFHIIPGWFNQTLPNYSGDPIAILRVDGDFYESIMETLNGLYKYLVKGGLIILDDYYYWQGATLAVHDFLSANKLTDKIMQFHDSYAYIVKE